MVVPQNKSSVKSGGIYRINANQKAFKHIGYKVEVVEFKFPRNLKAWIEIKKLLSSYDICVVESPKYIIYRLVARKVKWIYSAHNYEAGLRKEIALSSPSISTIKDLIIFSFFERLAIWFSDAVISISESLSRKLISLGAGNVLTMMPEVDCTQRNRNLNEKRSFVSEIGFNQYQFNYLVVGSFDWYPNRNFYTQLVNKIHLLDEFANGVRQFVFVGRGNDSYNDCLTKSTKVTTVGYVNDLDSLYNYADAAIVGVLIGSGVKIKLIEAISKGIPIIVSKKGAEGLEHFFDKYALPKTIEELIEKIKNFEQATGHHAYYSQEICREVLKENEKSAIRLGHLISQLS